MADCTRRLCFRNGSKVHWLLPASLQPTISQLCRTHTVTTGSLRSGARRRNAVVALVTPIQLYRLSTGEQCQRVYSARTRTRSGSEKTAPTTHLLLFAVQHQRQRRLATARSSQWVALQGMRRSVCPLSPRSSNLISPLLTPNPLGTDTSGFWLVT